MKMRLSVRNLWEFTKDRPPLVVVFICLIALVVTTYSFAFYMEQDIPILDSDVKHDWLQMLKHFNKLDACLENTIHQSSNDVASDTDRTVQTILTFENVDVLRKYTYVSGHLSTKGWEKSCQSHFMKPNNVEIFFHVPEIAPNISKIDLCVSLRAPYEYLPLFPQEYCSVLHKTDNRKKSHALLTTNADLEDTFCTGGSHLKMQFKLDKKVQFASYLNDDVKTIMYIRMVWVCFIGIIMVFVMILYALAYESHELKKDML